MVEFSEETNLEKGGEKAESDGKKEKLADLLEEYTATLKGVRRGGLVNGKVVGLAPTDVIVDIAYKAEGVIPRSEFSPSQVPKIGDQLRVLVEKIQDENGMVVLSKSKAERMISWEKVLLEYKEDSVVEGKVIRKVRGGLMVDVRGVEAFLPASQATLRGFSGMDELLGKMLKFKILKINQARKNVVVSRKGYLLEEKETARTKLLTELNAGELRKGIVRNITDFGAFIDLGGIDGLLHITDMSWGRISHPSEMVAVGDTVEVVILNFDRERMRVSLGLKQKTPSPWEGIEEKHPVGSQVKGKVVNILPYGAFVELEKGLEGLIHISDLSWTKRINHPTEVLAIGDMVEAVVLNTDKENQRLSLGVKQTESDPWEGAGERYLAGEKVRGKVRHVTDYGAFVELEDGIEGLIHATDISWTKKANPQEAFKKGQKIEAVVLSVESETHRISLGLKQLTPDPWEEIAKRYKLNDTVKAKVTSITHFGIFAELEKDLEALIHISEVNLPPGKTMDESFKVGDELTARVVRVDTLARKIALSLEDVGKKENTE